MTIDAKMVKDLRDMCGAGMMDCKRALEEAGGNVEEAVKILRTKGMATADKKASRAANEGLVHAYIHPGARVGVLVEVNCETDFVARNEFFVAFVHDVAMQIAASSPRWVKREDIPQDELDKELEIYKAQARETGKPENVLAKIAEGKLAKWYEQVVLLEQPFVKEPEKTVETLRRRLVGRIGRTSRSRGLPASG